jgi:hypothetical protein
MLARGVHSEYYRAAKHAREEAGQEQDAAGYPEETDGVLEPSGCQSMRGMRRLFEARRGS